MLSKIVSKEEGKQWYKLLPDWVCYKQL